MTDVLRLGGNIELIGFSSIDSGAMIVLKKIIGNYARKFSNKSPYDKLSITMSNGNDSFELNSTLVVNGRNIASSNSANNIFYAVDESLKKIEKEFI